MALRSNVAVTIPKHSSARSNVVRRPSRTVDHGTDGTVLGILNRFRFLARLSARFDRALAALLGIDLDHFTEVNQTASHLARLLDCQPFGREEAV